MLVLHLGAEAGRLEDPLAVPVEGVDVGKLTMQQLLSHQLGFQARALNFRTAYTDLVPIDQYPAVVNASGKATRPGFDYDNLGYLLYAAALEKRTGKSWRAWIEDIVFDPLGILNPGKIFPER